MSSSEERPRKHPRLDLENKQENSQDPRESSLAAILAQLHSGLSLPTFVGRILANDNGLKSFFESDCVTVFVGGQDGIAVYSTNQLVVVGSLALRPSPALIGKLCGPQEASRLFGSKLGDYVDSTDPDLVALHLNLNDRYLACSVGNNWRGNACMAVLITRGPTKPDWSQTDASYAQIIQAHFSGVFRAIEWESVVLEVARMLLSETKVESLLHKILRAGKDLVRCDRCSMFLVDEEANELYAYVFDETGQGADEVKPPPQVRFSVSSGVAGYVVRTGQALLVDDAYQYKDFNPAVDEKTGYHTKSLLCVPLFNPNKNVVGVVQFLNKQSHLDGTIVKFSPEDLHQVTIFASYCSIALTNARLHEACQKAERRYKVSLDVIAYHAHAHDDDVLRIVALPQIDYPAQDVFTTFFWDAYSAPDEATPRLVLRMFHELGLVERFKLKHETLCRFVLTVQRNYRKVPYHNWRHAFSVAHFFFALAKSVPLEQYLRDYEICGLFVASLCHDIDHRGRTNGFLIREQSALAELYDDNTSVLEQHHFSYTITLLSDSSLNIFENVSSDMYSKIIKQIRHVILSTDLAVHFKNLKNMKWLAQHSSEYDINNEEHRLHLTSLLMTSCDISALVKRFETHKGITNRIVEEFWMQGDEEKLLGLTPIPMMDRSSNVPQQQVQFIDSVAKDVYDALSQFLPQTKPVAQQLAQNRALWLEELANTNHLHNNNSTPVIHIPTH